MNYAVPYFLMALGFGIAGTLGFLLGRDFDKLMKRIESLEKKSKEPKIEPPKPGVAMGSYAPAPKAVGDVAGTSKTFGIVETKTPERLDWESQQAIEKEVLGR